MSATESTRARTRNGSQTRPEDSTLLTALLAAQAEFPRLAKDATNPHFNSKFVSLDHLMSEILPVLNKHGLVWVTLPTMVPETGAPVLTYRLVHAATGEQIEATMPLMLKSSDPQGQGSAITYARRYSMQALLGVVADEDDDGNKATRQESRAARSNGSERAVTADAPKTTERAASAAQKRMLNAKAGEKNLRKADLAVLLAAVAESPVDFQTPDAAENWYDRALDRIPARLVDPFLQAIANTDAQDLVAF